MLAIIHEECPILQCFTKKEIFIKTEPVFRTVNETVIKLVSL